MRECRPLFQEFAVTISLAILISGVVSLSLTPMLSSRVLRAGSGNAHGRVYRGVEYAFEVSREAYERSLHWAMAHRPLTLGFSAAVLIGTVVLFILVRRASSDRRTGRSWSPSPAKGPRSTRW